LSGQQQVWVTFVSGRSLRDLKQMVRLGGVCYVGNHGLELRGHGLQYVNPDAHARRPLLTELARRSRVVLRRIPGAWVEHKGLTLSLHWRAVPPAAHRRFRKTIAQLLAPYLRRRMVRLSRGKRVIEIRPRTPWGKGHIVAWLYRRVRAVRHGAQSLLMYLGDDETDEGAFRVVNRLGGISIRVGKPARRTAARYWLTHPREVCAWLKQLAEVRGETQGVNR